MMHSFLHAANDDSDRPAGASVISYGAFVMSLYVPYLSSWYGGKVVPRYGSISIGIFTYILFGGRTCQK